jgi:predicted lipoprotein
LLLGASLSGLGLLVGASLMQGCEEEKAAAPDRGAVLVALVDVVVLPSLAEVATRAEAMTVALDALATQPSEASLQGARAAWSEARGAFRRTLAFGIGPSDDILVTGGILDEPTNPEKLDTLLQAQPPVDLTAVRSAPASARGFLAIEALLFDPALSGEQLLARFSTDPLAEGYKATLKALGADLRDKLLAVVTGWEQDFARQVRSAGSGSSVFRAQRDAFDALLNRSLSVSDRALDVLRKSAGITTDDPLTPVADRSDRTLDDLRDDLRGIENLYTCSRDGKSGPSVASVVAEVNRGADEGMKAALAGALAALAGFQGPLRGAAASHQVEVDELLARLRQVKTTMATQVFNALGVSVGISDKDGD